MLHRPWSIIVMSTLLGLSGPLALAYWFSMHSEDFKTAWRQIDPIIVGLFALSTFVSYGVWKVRSWGYYTYLSTACLSLIYLLYDFAMAGNLDNYMPLALSTSFAIGTCILLQKHVSAPYFNPRLRWWERDPRYRVHLGVKFQIDRQTRGGSLLDISKSGCFAELDAKLIVGEEIEMRMQMIKFDFTTRAKVIWCSSDPKGYGLMFIGITQRHRREIDGIIAYLIEAHGKRGPMVNQGVPKAL